MDFKTEEYRGIEVTYSINTEGKFVCSALDVFREYKGNNALCWDTMKEAENAIHVKLDSFLQQTPKNYTELAKAIERSLVWTGHEDCHVDEFILKTIVGNFIEYEIKASSSRKQ